MLNRREFLLGSLGKVGKRLTQEDPIENRLDELGAALRNMGDASFMRDEQILRYLSAMAHKDLGITYYGTIMEDFAKGEQK